MNFSTPLFKKACHIFEADGRWILFDVQDIRAFYLDAIDQDVLELCDGRSGGEVINLLEGVHPHDTVKATLNKLSEEGMVGERRSEPAVVMPPDEMEMIHLNIDLAHDCNLACNYCYLKEILQHSEPEYMDEDIAKKGIDLLLREARGVPRCYVSFYGGEPLLHFQLLKRIVDYGYERAAAKGKEVVFDLTTNGLLLQDDIIQELVSRKVFIAVSIDGPSEVHDALRVENNQSGTYSDVVDRIQKLNCIENINFGLRSTITKRHLNWVERIHHFSEIAPSASQIYLHYAMLPEDAPEAISQEDLPEAKAALEALRRFIQDCATNSKLPWISGFEDLICRIVNGNRKLYACGAGIRNLTLSPDGSLYICPGLVDNPIFHMGDVFQGVDGDRRRKWLETYDIDVQRVTQADWTQYLSGRRCYLDVYLRSRDSLSELNDSMCEQAIAAYVHFRENAPEVLETRYRLVSEASGHPTSCIDHECMLHRVHR